MKPCPFPSLFTGQAEAVAGLSPVSAGGSHTYRLRDQKRSCPWKGLLSAAHTAEMETTRLTQRESITATQ